MGLSRSFAVVVALVGFVSAASAQPAPGASAPAAAASGAATARAAPAAGGDLVLDQYSYVRVFYRFGKMRIDGQALRKEGAELFGAEPAKREQAFRRYFRGQKVDWSADDWMDRVRVYFFRGQLGDDSRVMELMPETPPPAGWAGGDFDDASWQRRRLGLRKPMRYYQENFRDSSDASVRDAYYLAYFEVPDPAGDPNRPYGRLGTPACGDLTLTCVYRGGVRVLVNGRELARGHLGTGELGGDAHAEAYPRSAYLLESGEAPPDRVGHAGDIRCPFDDAPAYRDSKEFKATISNQPVSRKGWERLLALRDRRLENVKVPAALLRKGGNVLAIEVRGSAVHPIVLPGAGGPKADNWGNPFNPVWQHALLVNLELRTSKPGTLTAASAWPDKPQVWVEDMHARLFDNDCRPPGWPVGRVRIVGAANGTFGAQLGLAAGTAELSGLKVTPSELKVPPTAQPGKPVPPAIPASAWSVFYEVGHPLTELWKLGYCRSLPGLGEWGVDCPMAWQAVYRQVQDRARRKKGLAGLEFFDQLSPVAPAAVPGGRCQPIWLSLRLPETGDPNRDTSRLGTPAAAGTYAGSVRVEAAGMPPVDVPVEVEVLGWRIPSPRQFQTLVQSEQNPYGVAKGFGQDIKKDGKTVRQRLPLWTDEHFGLMESSFAQLARLGADWVYVPVLLDSEFGNRDDSPVRWIRRKNGSIDFDWTILDRYLDIAVKHLGPPRVVCFNIMHGAESPAAEVKVLDEASGQEQRVDLGPKVPWEKRSAYWQAFASAVMARMRARGLADSVYWGQAFDNVYDPQLIEKMNELAPGTHWAAAGHGRRPDANFRAVARAYASDVLDVSQQGWKQPVVHLLMPRTAGSIICVEGTSTPFTYRVLCDRAIYSGFNGVGRMGADYFELAFYDGCRGGEYQLVGRSCIMTLWPGQGAVDSSTRNEAMLEGIQEADARIYLEQLLDRKLLNNDLARQVQQVLDEHARATLYIPTSGPSTDLMEVAGDWQGRSRRLYAAAAQAAAVVPMDIERASLGAAAAKSVYLGQEHTDAKVALTVPAGGKTTVPLRLRNWTTAARAWKASADQKWIVPESPEGKLAGHGELRVTLDGRGLEPGATVSGTLSFADPAAGVTIPVAVSAVVEKGLELRLPALAMNVQGDKADSLDAFVINRTDAAREWKFESASPLVACEPPSGRIEPGAMLPVKLTAGVAGVSVAAATGTPATRAVKVGLKGGELADQAELTVFVMPAYAEPAVPAGEAVPLEQLPKSALASHFSRGGPLKWALNDERAPLFAGGAFKDAKLTIGAKTFARGMWLVPHGQTVYKLDGSYIAFVSEVGVNAASKANKYHVPGLRVCFDVYVDGQLRASSGLMGDGDEPRRVVAAGLDQAKELKLVTRMERLGDSPMNNSYPGYLGYICNWAEPRLIKK